MGERPVAHGGAAHRAARAADRAVAGALLPVSRLFQAIEEHARRAPHRPAICDGSATVCYAEVLPIIEHIETQLRDRYPRAEPVVLQMENSAAWALLDLALLRAARPVVPVPREFTEAQVAHVLGQTGARCVLREPRREEPVASTLSVLDRVICCSARRGALLSPSLPCGTAKVTFTSGSTGRPKGVCLSLAGLETVAHSVVEHIGADHTGLHCAVLSLAVLLENVAGLYATLIAGGQYHVPSAATLGLDEPSRPDFRRLVRALSACRATRVIMVPELLRGTMGALALSTRGLPDLRLLAVGDGALAPRLLAQSAALGLPVIEGYGMAEMGSLVALSALADNRAGSVGRPLPHVRIERAADGELLIHQPIFLGYLGAVQMSATLHTGDLGRIDAAGRVRLLGRKSSLLNTAFGRTISPEWIESELLSEPQIGQALVFGDDAPALGALIVPSAAELPAEQIERAIERANERLPDYAAVRHWSIVAPFSAAGGELTGNGRLRRAAISIAHAGRMSRTLEAPGLYRSFFDRLVTDTAAERAALDRIAQIGAAVRGELPLAIYRAYLCEAYHHFKHAAPLMTLALANLKPAQKWLRDVLVEYIAEQSGHEQWILDDIRSAGGDPHATLTSTPRPASQRMLEYAYEYITSVNAAGFFGLVFAVQEFGAPLAHSGAQAHPSSPELAQHGLRYRVARGAYDRAHGAHFRQLMDRVEAREDQDAIVTVANTMFGLLGELLAGIACSRVQ